MLLAATDIEAQLNGASVKTVVYSATALICLVIIAALFKDRYKFLKLPLFLMMTLAIAGSTITLFGITIYLNTVSWSKGPVHWHADIEFWACGNELEIINPQSAFSNKVGTSTYHEHNDRRIHLEGVVVDRDYDPSIGKFMDVIGGDISNDKLVLPLGPDTYSQHEDGDGPSKKQPDLINEYLVDYSKPKSTSPDYKNITSFDTSAATFQKCGDQPAEVQTFVYQYDGKTKTYSQKKLVDPAAYTISDQPNVPPGDCIIVEYDVAKDYTDKLCEQYGVKDLDRCEKFGVPANQKAKVCTIREVNNPLFPGGTR